MRKRAAVSNVSANEECVLRTPSEAAEVFNDFVEKWGGVPSEEPDGCIAADKIAETMGFESDEPIDDDCKHEEAVWSDDWGGPVDEDYKRKEAEWEAEWNDGWD